MGMLRLIFIFTMKKFLLLPLSDEKHKIAEDRKRDQRNKQQIVSEEIKVA